MAEKVRVLRVNIEAKFPDYADSIPFPKFENFWDFVLKIPQSLWMSPHQNFLNFRLEIIFYSSLKFQKAL